MDVFCTNLLLVTMFSYKKNGKSERSCVKLKINLISQKHQFPWNMISFSLICVSKTIHRLRSLKTFYMVETRHRRVFIYWWFSKNECLRIIEISKSLIIKIDTIVPVYLQLFIASTLLFQMWISFLSVKSHISVLVAYEVWNENNWKLCHICNNGTCDFLKFGSIHMNQWYSIIFMQFYLRLCWKYFIVKPTLPSVLK